MKSKVSRS